MIAVIAVPIGLHHVVGLHRERLMIGFGRVLFYKTDQRFLVVKPFLADLRTLTLASRSPRNPGAGEHVQCVEFQMEAAFLRFAAERPANKLTRIHPARALL